MTLHQETLKMSNSLPKNEVLLEILDFKVIDFKGII